MGWIKLHRELMNKPIWTDSTPEQKVILITLLLMANYKSNSWIFGGELYSCAPGQFVTSVKSIAHASGKGITDQKVRTALSRFKTHGFLTSESTNKNTMITICNWETYQISEEEDNEQPNKRITNNQQTDNKRITTIEEGKKEKKEITKEEEGGGKDTDCVLNFWNSFDNLPKVRALSKARKKHIHARLLESLFRDNWESVIKSISQSKFLTGDNDRNWRATFDWFIKNDQNYVKVLEGRYAQMERKTEGIGDILNNTSW